ncbi:MAG: hypothetical protein JEZ02_03650 [Desulfatibacillum sp.]|nr:hypothetical protein [Desulfatibacillum sp.]
MGWKIPFRKIVVLMWMSILVVCLTHSCWAVESDAWKTLETQFTKIQYLSQDDLKHFHDSLNFGPGKWSAKRIIESQGSSGLESSLKNKVDAMYERVQDILDMRPKMAAVRIRVLPDKKYLTREYESIYKARCNVRSWYLYEANTIYINSQDIHEGILAHEMGHAISDHFLVIRPPRVSAEVWSMYVEAHLFDD